MFASVVCMGWLMKLARTSMATTLLGSLVVAVAVSAPRTTGPIVNVGYSRAAMAVPLHTSANAVLNGNGVKVILGGIHRGGYLTATGDDMGSAEADALAHWTSMVRVATSASLVADSCATGGAAYLNRLDSIVTQLTSRNIVALIDMHLSAPMPCTTPRALQLPAKVEARAYWTLIAKRYASNPLVAFELWNEPHTTTTDQYLNGGTVDDGSGGSYLAAGMQELYNLVHSLTTTNLIFVDGNGWAGNPMVFKSMTVDKTRTVFAMHVYTCIRPDPACINDPVQQQFPANNGPFMGPWDSLSFSIPIAVTETGFPNPATKTWFTGATAWSNKHNPRIGIIGFADDGNWAGSPWTLTSGAPNWTPNAAGAPLATWMATVQPPH